MTTNAVQCQEDTHLAVLNPAGGARVLALNPHGLGSFFEEPGLIDNQDRIIRSQVFAGIADQFISQLMGIPPGSAQKSLKTIGTVLSQILGQLPTVLSIH